MDRDQQAAAAVNLLDREQRIIADILSHFRDIVFHATDTVNNSSSAGQASYNSFAMDLKTQALIKSTEDLLQLTRQLRELWIVGPLRLPSDGNNEVEQNIDDEVTNVLGIVNRLREASRKQMLEDQGGHGAYVSIAPKSESQAGATASQK